MFAACQALNLTTPRPAKTATPPTPKPQTPNLSSDNLVGQEPHYNQGDRFGVGYLIKGTRNQNMAKGYH